MVPSGKALVLMVSTPAIAIESALVATAPALSVTRTVKLAVPPADGVPAMTPAPVIGFSPAGSAPADNDHVKGAVPPVAAMVWEYATPTVQSGKEVVVMERAPATAIEKALVVVAPTLSVTRMLKLAFPAADGVPVMAPSLVMGLNPAGSAPSDNVHFNGAVPPVATAV